VIRKRLQTDRGCIKPAVEGRYCPEGHLAIAQRDNGCPYPHSLRTSQTPLGVACL
jgi:hypothetical protein